MKWEYSEPAGKLFLLDGRFAWFYSRGDSQVQRISAKELDDLRLAAALSAGPHATGKGIEQPDAGAICRRPLHAHRPAQGTGKASGAVGSHGDCGWNDYPASRSKSLTAR